MKESVKEVWIKFDSQSEYFENEEKLFAILDERPGDSIVKVYDISKSKEMKKMQHKKEPAHADKPRTPITIIRLEGLKCQEESAEMVQIQCNASVMQSAELKSSVLKSYRTDVKSGCIPPKS